MAQQILAAEHLHLLSSEASATQAHARRALHDLTDEQLAWRPDEGSWCIAECYDHLRKVDRPYLKPLDDAIRRAASAGETDFRPGLIGRFMIKMMDPGSRVRMPAPRKIQPRSVTVGDARQTIEEYLEQQAELMNLIQLAEGRDINGPRVPTPLSKLIALSIGEALTLLVRHGERHRLQADRVRSNPRFPS